MSEKAEWALRKARHRARTMSRELEDVSARSYVVGSIRRGCDPVGDVELLVEPRAGGQGSLFGGEGPDVEAVERVVRGWGEWQKGGQRFMQVLKPIGRDRHLQVDVFVCSPPAEWGTLMAIRTGPAELGKRAVTRIKSRGWRVMRGAVWRPGDDPGPGDEVLDESNLPDGVSAQRPWIKVPTPTEREFFAAAGLRTIPPRRRDDGVPELSRKEWLEP